MAVFQVHRQVAVVPRLAEVAFPASIHSQEDCIWNGNRVGEYFRTCNVNVWHMYFTIEVCDGI